VSKAITTTPKFEALFAEAFLDIWFEDNPRQFNLYHERFQGFQDDMIWALSVEDKPGYELIRAKAIKERPEYREAHQEEREEEQAEYKKKSKEEWAEQKFGKDYKNQPKAKIDFQMREKDGKFIAVGKVKDKKGETKEIKVEGKSQKQALWLLFNEAKQYGWFEYPRA